MSATAQPEGKGDSGKVQENKTPEQKDDKTVAIGEFIEMRQQLRQAQEKIAAMEAAKSAPPKTESDPAKTQLSETEQINQRFKDMERRERLRDLASELGLADQKQSQAVFDLLSKNADLAPPEALELAAKRNPDLFKERGVAGFDKNTHGSLRPAPGNHPPETKPSEHKQRLDKMKDLVKLGRRHQAEEFAIDMIGAAGAKALGWEYKQKPIQ